MKENIKKGFSLDEDGKESLRKGKFWLVTTDHLTDRIWFREDDDFKAGMNYVALLAANCRACIMAFILMSNHVHFILGGSKAGASNFIENFKKLYSQYFQSKYNFKELLRNNRTDIREVYVGDESFERAIAYVQMNCVVANICISSTAYQWGTGNVFFNESPVQGTLVGDMKVADRRKMLHSKRDVPSDFIVTENGYISPSSYVQIEYVESVFRTPKRMLYFLLNTSKSKQHTSIPSFSDQVLFSAIQNLSMSAFDEKNLKNLCSEKMSQLLKQVRYRFSTDVRQIARVTGIPAEEVEGLIDMF